MKISEISRKIFHLLEDEKNDFFDTFSNLSIDNGYDMSEAVTRINDQCTQLVLVVKAILESNQIGGCWEQNVVKMVLFEKYFENIFLNRSKVEVWLR